MTEPLSNSYQNWYRFSRNPTAVIGVVIVVLVVIAVVVALLLIPGRMRHPAMVPLSATDSGPTPRQILDERYAKSDLTTEEYLERVKHLGPS